MGCGISFSYPASKIAKTSPPEDGSFKPEYADFYAVINQQLECNSSASRIGLT